MRLLLLVILLSLTIFLYPGGNKYNHNFLGKSSGQLVPKPNECEDRCFIVTSHLAGNHSPNRMKQAVLWFEHATMQSITKAIRRHQEKDQRSINAPCGWKKHFLVLEVSRNYLQLLTNRNLSQQTPLDIIFTGEGSNLDPRIFLNCSTMFLSRIDSDDLLDINFFEKISNFNAETGHATLLGSNELQTLVLDKDDGKVLCRIGKVKKSRKYQFSLGQTVVISYKDWTKHIFPKTLLGDHTRLLSVFKEIAPDIKVKTAKIYPTGLYTVTRLSGHFSKVNKECTAQIFSETFGNSYGESIVAAINFLPNLTKQEIHENNFWLTAAKSRKSFLSGSSFLQKIAGLGRFVPSFI